MANTRPHIIYILSDEHRGQAMTHMGDPNIRTPVMDRLAGEGASFERAYANCPICTPARGTIFSGRHAHSGPVSGFFEAYKATAPSTATILREAGYHTAYFGKWHCGIVHNQKPELVRDHPDEYKGASMRTPERHRAGFQDWRGMECINQHFASFYYKDRDENPTKIPGYETDGLTDLVIDYLKDYDRGEPLFLVLSINPPHFPLEVPEQWERFKPEALEVRPNFTDTPEMRADLATYYAMIENLDWNMGRLMETIASLDGFEDTLTVYFSDHGDFMGSHGVSRGKNRPHEESVRIPAIFHWPGRTPAQGTIPGLFSLVDLLPTTLGLINHDIPVHNQGTDLSPLVRGESAEGPDEVLLEMVGNPRWSLQMRDWRGLVTEKWKYAFYETGDQVLFDLEHDPYEMNNLAYTDEETRRAMEQRLLQLLADTREPFFDILIEHGVPQDAPDLDVSEPC
ncbi:MAG: sulfatase-like hydrolase/transferase [Nitrospiraceae bacterium]|nr:sulfatase-like hydrolase/transferase [Nitrospiraceae bacterium]